MLYGRIQDIVDNSEIKFCCLVTVLAKAMFYGNFHVFFAN